MNDEFTTAELEAYLDEALDSQRAAELEAALRGSKPLAKRLAQIIARRDAGVHSLGDIWRRGHFGVPTREHLGSFLLGVLDEGHADYIRFRLEVLKCPFTAAKLRDLQAQQADAEPKRVERRRKFYRSTAGFLGGEPEP